MDTSEEYINMCRAATEIQGGWKPSVGDYTLVEEPTMISYKKGNITFKPFPNPRVGIITDISYGRFAVQFFAWCNPKNNVWLPRQDQLQDMIGIYTLEDLIYHDVDIVSQYYDALSIDEYYKSFASLEITFLAMVMKCYYGKKWNGSEWA